jgi:uncharacterized membrane protein YfcA
MPDLTALPVWTDPVVIGELIGVGMLAGYLNVIAGGGSLLAVPLLIFLGLPEGVANATSRLAIFMQAATAVAKYRSAGKLDWKLSRTLVPACLIGAVAGALVATRVSDALFRSILAWVMIACASVVVAEPFLLGRKARDPSSEAYPELKPIKVWPTMLVVGFYGGMVQAGMGYVMLAGLVLALGIRLAEANVMKMVLVVTYTPLALSVFIGKGMVNWPFGILLAIGQGFGGWLGATAALKRGEGFVRAVLAVTVLLTATKLLWFP